MSGLLELPDLEKPSFSLEESRAILQEIAGAILEAHLHTMICPCNALEKVFSAITDWLVQKELLMLSLRTGTPVKVAMFQALVYANQPLVEVSFFEFPKNLST